MNTAFTPGTYTNAEGQTVVVREVITSRVMVRGRYQDSIRYICDVSINGGASYRESCYTSPMRERISPAIGVIYGERTGVRVVPSDRVEA